jgi:homoserine dehydrogenase
VLAAIATEFGRHGVSIRSMNQRGVASGPKGGGRVSRPPSERDQEAVIGDDARLIFVTHKAREADLRATVHALQGVEPVHRVGSVLRVMGEEE